MERSHASNTLRQTTVGEDGSWVPLELAVEHSVELAEADHIAVVGESVIPFLSLAGHINELQHLVFVNGPSCGTLACAVVSASSL